MVMDRFTRYAHYLAHWMLVICIMAFFVFVLNAGDAMEYSASLMTGSAVHDQYSEGQVTVSGDAQWYLALAQTHEINVETRKAGFQTKIILSGPNDQVHKTVMDLAEQAQRRGDLVNYFMSVSD